MLRAAIPPAGWPGRDGVRVALVPLIDIEARHRKSLLPHKSKKRAKSHHHETGRRWQRDPFIRARFATHSGKTAG